MLRISLLAILVLGGCGSTSESRPDHPDSEHPSKQSLPLAQTDTKSGRLDTTPTGKHAELSGKHTEPTDKNTDQAGKARPFPKKTYDLPSSKAELLERLKKASPELAIAIKGRLRSLNGSGTLSFERVAVVGASLSAGFGGLPLSKVFDNAIRGSHEVFSIASTFFFRSPYANGRTQIDEALAANATAIVAIDLLFWYVYQNTSQEQRIANLESGLKNLERIDVPLILGDIPDMRTGEPWMLSPSAVPPPEQLADLNNRVREWAKHRLHVHIVPLEKWSAALATNGDVVIEPGLQPIPAKSLITADGLHPNAKGVRYMVVRLDPSLEVGFPETLADALTF